MKRGMIILISLLLVISACQKQEVSPTRTYGTVYFLIKDMPANMESVSSLEITISKILVHTSDDDRWVTVSNTPKTFDLVSLQDSDLFGLLSDNRLEVGNYNQIRFEISKVKAVVNSQKTTVKIPSNTIKVNYDLEVLYGNGNVVLLDFILNESIHATGEGKLIFAPVIHLENYNGATVSVNEDKATLKGGNKKSSIEVGMDENGVVAPGNKVRADVELTIDSYGIIKKVDPNIQKELPRGTGALLLSVSDEKLFDLTNITSLSVVLSSVEIHKIGTPDESWIAINSTPKEFNLLELNSSSAIFASVNLENALYNQIRFNVVNASIVRNGVSVPLVLPSSKLKFVGNYKIDQNKTTQVDFDFDPSRSLVSAGDRIQLKPTIRVVVSKEVEFEVEDAGKLKIKSSSKVEENEFLFE